MEEINPLTHYEKLVQENDPYLYELIKAHVFLIPDTRPKSTIEKMKKEEQDNWMRVYIELCAMCANNDHWKLMNNVMSGNRKKIISYLVPTNRSWVDQFSIAYPAILFLLTKISPLTSLVPFLIFINQVDYILDAKITIEDLDFIDNIDTAKKLYPNNKDVILINSDNFIKSCKEKDVGHIFWYLASGIVDPNVNSGHALVYAAGHNDYEVIKILLDDPRTDPTICMRTTYTSVIWDISDDMDVGFYFNALEAAIRANHIEAIKLFLAYENLASLIRPNYFEASLYRETTLNFYKDFIGRVENRTSEDWKQLGAETIKLVVENERLCKILPRETIEKYEKFR